MKSWWKTWLMLALAAVLTATAVPAQLSSASSWLEILQGRRHQLVLFEKFIDRSQEGMAAGEAGLNEMVQQTEQRYFQMLFLLESSLDNPYEASLIYQGLFELSASLSAALKPFDSGRQECQQMLSSLSYLEKDLQDYLERPSSRGYRQEIEKLINRLHIVQAKLAKLEETLAGC